MSLVNRLNYSIWNIGFIDSNIEDIVLGSQNVFQVNWLKHHYKDRFFADPFIYSVDDDTIKVLVEDFPFYHKQGCISMLTIDRHNYVLISKKTILTQNYHMSYPFILRHSNGKTWVIPESSMSGNLFSYEMDPKSEMLIKQSLVMKEPLLDSTYLEYNKKWWLFCTKRGQNSNSDLYIFYADSLEGPFSSHPGNPHIQNSAMARPAGNFIKIGNNLYRVTQKCDKRYGEAIIVTKVESLSESEFKESYIKEIHAQNDDYSYGFHTINGKENITVVDGLKNSFRPFHRLWYELRNAI